MMHLTTGVPSTWKAAFLPIMNSRVVEMVVRVYLGNVMFFSCHIISFILCCFLLSVIAKCFDLFLPEDLVSFS